MGTSGSPPITRFPFSSAELVPRRTSVRKYWTFGMVILVCYDIGTRHVRSLGFFLECLVMLLRFCCFVDLLYCCVVVIPMFRLPIHDEFI